MVYGVHLSVLPEFTYLVLTQFIYPDDVVHPPGLRISPLLWDGLLRQAGWDIDDTVINPGSCGQATDVAINLHG